MCRGKRRFNLEGLAEGGGRRRVIELLEQGDAPVRRAIRALEPVARPCLTGRGEAGLPPR